jgi:hypothetical protein
MLTVQEYIALSKSARKRQMSMYDSAGGLPGHTHGILRVAPWIHAILSWERYGEVVEKCKANIASDIDLLISARHI